MKYKTWEEEKRKWLGNFSKPQTPAAETLIDQLDIHSTEEVQLQIRLSIAKILNKSKSNEIIVINAIKDLGNLKSHYFDEDYNALQTKNQNPVAYADFTPTDQTISTSPGSEAQLSYWVRNLVSDFKFQTKKNGIKNKILPISKADYTTLGKQITNGGKIKFIFVSDMSLSGDEAIRYGKSFKNSPLVQLYGKSVELILVCFSVSAKALENINKANIFDDVIFTYFSKSLYDLKWLRYQEFHEIRRICTQFSPNLSQSQRGKALGYKESGNLTITDFFIPNNTPVIFYYDVNFQDIPYSPLFASRYTTHPRRPIRSYGHDALDINSHRICRGISEKNTYKRLESYNEKIAYLVLVFLLKKSKQNVPKKYKKSKHLRNYQNIKFSDICICLGVSNYVIAKNVYRLFIEKSISLSCTVRLPKDLIRYNPEIKLASGVKSLQDLGYDTLQYAGNRNPPGRHRVETFADMYYPLS